MTPLVVSREQWRAVKSLCCTPETNGMEHCVSTTVDLKKSYHSCENYCEE